MISGPPQIEATQEQRVLVIDDDPHILELLEVCLRRAGCEVSMARSWDEAIAQWHGRRPLFDLVVVDYNLGIEQTGLDLIDQFRAECPGLKTILLTGHELDHRFAGRMEGFDFLKKPFKLGALVGAVNAQLSVR